MSKVIITKIFWKRTYLFIEYVSESDVEITIAKIVQNKKSKLKELKKSYLLESKKIDECLYRAKINITIAGGRSILEPGRWEFLIDNKIDNYPAIADEILYCIEDICRVFRYAQEMYAYIVTFNIKAENIKIDNVEKISLCMVTSFMKNNKKPYKTGPLTLLSDSENFKIYIRKIIVFFFKNAMNIFYQLIVFFTQKSGNKILFMSENRVKIMDNLETIDNRLKERKLDKKFQIDYSFRNIFDTTKKQKLFDWIRVIIKIAKSDIIFVDDYVPVFSFLDLDKKTKLVQVWHAGFGFKLVGYGRFGINGSPHPLTSCHRKYTYGIIGNEYLKEIYSEVWGIEKEALLPTGMPRLEKFLNKENMEKVQDDFFCKYPQLKGKNIITFAPTYRGLSQINAFYDYNKIDFIQLYKYCKKTNSAILFGKHHFIKQDIPIKEEHKEVMYDMSMYKLNDLFYITDILITDYSSCFYDFLLLNKPILFFVYDKSYYSATRGVHRPIDDIAPGKVCNNFEELIDSLNNKDYGDKKVAKFLIDNCLTNNMLASDQVIDYVILNKEVENLCKK